MSAEKEQISKAVGHNTLENSPEAVNALHAFEIMGEAAVLTRLDGSIFKVTSAFDRLVGFSTSELAQTSADDFLFDLLKGNSTNGPGKEIFVNTLKHRDHERGAGGVFRVRNHDGHLRWVEPVISNVTDHNEVPVGKLLVLRDVTAMHQARLTAEESEQKYRELVERVNSVVVRVDLDFNIQFVNEYANHFFAYGPDGLAGRSLLDTLVPARGPDGEELQATLTDLVNSPELHGAYDQPNRRGDGSWVWVHWSVRAIRNPQGKVSGLLLSGIDITARKQAELRADHYLKRIQNLSEELVRTEERVRMRVAQYLHDQIIQVLSLANIRLGGITAAVKDAGLAEQTERLEGVRRLIQDSVSESRSLLDELVPPMLDEIGLGAAFRVLADKQHLNDGTQIHVDDRTEGEKISRDLRAILYQSGQELLMNALKYAGPCQILIQVKADDNAVELTVVDDGCGFDARKLDEKAGHAEGGFGLFSIRERIRRFEGSLCVDSSPGKGTRATIIIPFSN